MAFPMLEGWILVASFSHDTLLAFSEEGAVSTHGLLWWDKVKFLLTCVNSDYEAQSHTVRFKLGF